MQRAYDQYSAERDPAPRLFTSYFWGRNGVIVLCERSFFPFFFVVYFLSNTYDLGAGEPFFQPML